MAFSIKYLVRSINISKNLVARNIMTTSSKSEKALEKLQKNPYFDKYADRIAALQQTSPEEFLQRVEQTSVASQRRDGDAAPAPAAVDTRQYSSVLNPKTPLKENIPVEDKKLEKIFKLELVEDKNVEEIAAIWEEYHKNKELLSATIPTTLYQRLAQCMQQHPTFLFPLPRDQGYEFVLCQSSGHSLHFTPLLAYQVHKENAPECLTVTHYTELAARGLVLMRGEYDKNVLTGKEAQCLVNQFQMYYSGNEEEKSRLLKAFSASPDAFRHMDLITQLESIGLPASPSGGLPA